ncbi:CatA-like O-acetyltransferase [Cryobacterium sp. Y57]|nr:CatA-like O-acetyltransferase [Cryobacterium sp. Y57]
MDLATWPRREHFDHYQTRVPCTYNVTVQLDATRFVPISAVR